MFDKIKDIMQLRSQMAEVKKRLDNMVVKVESPKKYFEVVVSGSQEIKEVKVLKDLSGVEAVLLEAEIKEMVNDAVRKSQMMAAQAMGDLSGLGQA